LLVAVQNLNYHAEKHANDLLDSEQLVYLADPRLRFLTADRGYLKRIKQSAQRANIHLLASKPFNAPADVEDRLRKILI